MGKGAIRGAQGGIAGDGYYRDEADPDLSVPRIDYPLLLLTQLGGRA